MTSETMLSIWTGQSMSDDFKVISAKVQRNIDLIKATANAMLFRKQMEHVGSPGAVLQPEFMEALRRWQTSISSSSFEGDAKVQSDIDSIRILDHHYIPFPENSKFFPRDDVLACLRSNLNHDSKDMHHRSMLLWGIGGIGKTQLALAYSYERKRHGLHHILWISSETKDTILQSCTDLSVKLRLHGAVEGGQHDNNRRLLMKWLHDASKYTPI